jgi:L-threonylcarbamoyladenylate synthase
VKTTNCAEAAKVLKLNGLIGLPTETVYGLAGNAFSEEAIRGIFALKQRPLFNPLIVHIPSATELNWVAQEIPEKARVLAQTFWPGALTLVLKKKAVVPDCVTAGKDTVAVRVPNHPLALKLLRMLDFPLAAPSANPFGSISPTTADHVVNYFQSGLEVVLDGGACSQGIESTIVGFENGEPILYRHGAISKERIEEAIGEIAERTKIVGKNSVPEASGMLSRHYAPATKTILLEDPTAICKDYLNKKIGLLRFTQEIEDLPNALQLVLSRSGDFTEAAKNLYAMLHQLDQANLNLIVVEPLPNRGLGISINDRLSRAVAD